MRPMVEASSNLTWIPRLETKGLVARRLEYAEDYARVWIDREEKAGRLKSRCRTVKKWHVLAADRDIDELYVYDLAAAGRLPTPRGEETEGVRWSEAQAIAWATLGQPLSLHQWPPEIGSKL